MRSDLSLRLGLIQTAYANGASTQYINGTLGVPVGCTKTGVKFLHHMATQYHIGVYFEANGHGTVVFSDQAKAAIRAAAEGGMFDDYIVSYNFSVLLWRVHLIL